MFNTAIKKISDTSDIIDHILEEYGTNMGVKALSLVSMEGLVFGTYHTSDLEEVILNNTAFLLQTLEFFYNSKGFRLENIIRHDLPMNSLSMRGEKLFEYSEQHTPVYLWLLSQHIEISEEKLEAAKKELLPLVRSFV